MKRVLLLILPIIFCISCSKKQPETETKWVDPKQLVLAPVRHESLSEPQLQRVAAIQKILAEVRPSPLEKWVDDFKREANLDRELTIWETIGSAYLRYQSERELSNSEKKELLGILLVGSGAPPDEAIKHLKLVTFSETQARRALEIFSDEWRKKQEEIGH